MIGGAGFFDMVTTLAAATPPSRGRKPRPEGGPELLGRLLRGERAEDVIREQEQRPRAVEPKIPKYEVQRLLTNTDVLEAMARSLDRMLPSAMRRYRELVEEITKAYSRLGEGGRERLAVSAAERGMSLVPPDVGALRSSLMDPAQARFLLNQLRSALLANRSVLRATSSPDAYARLLDATEELAKYLQEQQALRPEDAIKVHVYRGGRRGGYTVVAEPDLPAISGTVEALRVRGYQPDVQRLTPRPAKEYRGKVLKRVGDRLELVEEKFGGGELPEAMPGPEPRIHVEYIEKEGRLEPPEPRRIAGGITVVPDLSNLAAAIGQRIRDGDLDAAIALYNNWAYELGGRPVLTLEEARQLDPSKGEAAARFALLAELAANPELGGLVFLAMWDPKTMPDPSVRLDATRLVLGEVGSLAEARELEPLLQQMFQRHRPEYEVLERPVGVLPNSNIGWRPEDIERFEQRFGPAGHAGTWRRTQVEPDVTFVLGPYGAANGARRPIAELIYELATGRGKYTEPDVARAYVEGLVQPRRPSEWRLNIWAVSRYPFLFEPGYSRRTAGIYSPAPWRAAMRLGQEMANAWLTPTVLLRGKEEIARARHRWEARRAAAIAALAQGSAYYVPDPPNELAGRTPVNNVPLRLWSNEANVTPGEPIRSPDQIHARYWARVAEEYSAGNQAVVNAADRIARQMRARYGANLTPDGVIQNLPDLTEMGYVRLPVPGRDVQYLRHFRTFSRTFWALVRRLDESDRRNLIRHMIDSGLPETAVPADLRP